jgi:hypothetical protein
MRKTIFILALVMSFFTLHSQEKQIEITMVDVVPGKDSYYFELVKRSLENCGYEVKMNIKTDIPILRVDEYLASSKIDAHFYMDTTTRRKRYPNFADVGLTNGLTGKRVLFIPKGCADIYGNVKNLEDFRALNKTGGFGEGWTDAKIWKHNNLNYYEKSGDYRLIFDMLKSQRRGIDYFSRSVMEIINESVLYPELDIEPHMLFVYNNLDFKLFFSPKAVEKKNIVEKAILEAQKSGLIDELLKEFYPKIFSSTDGLNLSNRVELNLNVPEEVLPKKK